MDVQPENSNSVEAAWEFQARAAADWDERSRNSTTTWVPPILAALVDRARRSSLTARPAAPAERGKDGTRRPGNYTAGSALRMAG